MSILLIFSFLLISFDFDLIDYLANKDIVKDVYDSKLAYISLRKVGITLQNIGFDILLASYLLNPDIKKIEDIFFNYNIEIAEINKNSSYEENIKHALSIYTFIPVGSSLTVTP
jgi:DNA polymerase I-like protein with 3'-5' exonuclease and polymerase domains